MSIFFVNRHSRFQRGGGRSVTKPTCSAGLCRWVSTPANAGKPRVVTVGTVVPSLPCGLWGAA